MVGLFKKKQKTDLQKLIEFIVKYNLKKRKLKKQKEKEAKKFQMLQQKAEWEAAHPSALGIMIADIKNTIHTIKVMVGAVMFIVKLITVIKAIIVIIAAVVQALEKKYRERSCRCHNNNGNCCKNKEEERTIEEKND